MVDVSDGGVLYPQPAEEVFYAFGHRNVRALHTSTIELTTSPILTLRGDCIIGVRASKAARHLSEAFKRVARQSRAELVFTLNVGGFNDAIMGSGSPLLTFEDPVKMIIRKSTHVCGATVMVAADKSASELSRDFVSALRRGNARLSIKLTAVARR